MAASRPLCHVRTSPPRHPSASGPRQLSPESPDCLLDHARLQATMRPPRTPTTPFPHALTATAEGADVHQKMLLIGIMMIVVIIIIIITTSSVYAATIQPSCVPSGAEEKRSSLEPHKRHHPPYTQRRALHYVLAQNLYTPHSCTQHCSNNAIHPLCNKVAHQSKRNQPSRNRPEPVEVLHVLTGHKTSLVSFSMSLMHQIRHSPVHAPDTRHHVHRQHNRPEHRQLA